MPSVVRIHLRPHHNLHHYHIFGFGICPKLFYFKLFYYLCTIYYNQNNNSMKFKLFIAALGMFASLSLFASSKQANSISVDPPMWWTGMANDTLQLMIKAPGAASYTATAKYPGVKIIDNVYLDSPDYLFIYLTIDKTAKPGNLPIKLTNGNVNVTFDYPLLARDRKPEDYIGFDAGDVLYLVMPDRFADGNPTNNEMSSLKNQAKVDRTKLNSRHGGDIKGIEQHLDYIDSLGVTAIWLNPVLENDMRGGSYHGYSTTDFYKIDPRLGTNEEYVEFIKKASDRGLKVVMDMIFNHCGSEHPWLKNPPSKDWFNFPDYENNYVQTNHRLSTLHDPYASEYDLKQATDGWFVKSMPDLNQRNPHLMKYLIQNSIWWIEYSKINGIRMDTYPYADIRAMARWIDAVLAEYPNFNIVGECWYAHEGSEAFWQRNSKVNPEDPRLPTVMDFRISIDAQKAFDDETNEGHDGLNILYDHLSLDHLFANPQKVLTFVDNHDTDRYLRTEPDSLDTWKQAMTFLLTSRGIPQIYYGTELLMNGTRADGGDGNVRRDMPGGFEGDTTNVFTRAGRSDLQNEAYDFLSNLLNWRRTSARDVVTYGSLKHFVPSNKLYVYQRKLDSREITVILNGTSDNVTADMSRYAEILSPGTVLTNVITGNKVTISPEMTFTPRQILVLQNF